MHCLVLWDTAGQEPKINNGNDNDTAADADQPG
jgi:hypothetical protein